jgi:hypothetical protein
MKKAICCVAVLSCLIGIVSQVTAAPESDSKQASQEKKALPEAPYTAPYPFTADELWEKMLKVAGQREGYVTKDQVNKIFGTNLKLNEIFQKQYHQKIYTLMRGKDWYFNLSVGENSPTRSFFFFSWGESPGQHTAEYPPPPPPGMCINVYKIRPNLYRRGWMLRREVRGTSEPIYSDTYRTGGRYGVLKIEFLPSDNCLRTFRVSASHSEAEQLPIE